MTKAPDQISQEPQPTAADGSVDVVVIGAGIGGLTAAWRLTQAGLSTVVLEASEQVGGRLLNHASLAGPVEVGGEWLGPTQDHVLSLTKELDLSLVETYRRGRHFFEANGRKFKYRGDFPVLGINLLHGLDACQLYARLKLMAMRVSVEAPWKSKNAAQWDRQSVGAWLERNSLTRGGRDLFSLVFRTLACIEPEEMSVLSLLTHIHSIGGATRVTSVSHGGQKWRVEGGSQRIALSLAERLGDKVRLGSPVRSVAAGDGFMRVATDHSEHTCKRVVVAVPLPMTDQIDFTPPLPEVVMSMVRDAAMGAVTKCNLVYPTAFWREQGLSGRIYSADDGLVQAVFDNTPTGSDKGVLVSLVTGGLQRDFAKKTPEERRASLEHSIARFLGPQALHSVEYLEQDWTQERWIGGGYTPFLPPQGLLKYGPALRRASIHGVEFVGSDYAVRHAGFMDGAVDSAEAAARKIAAELADVTGTSFATFPR